LNCCSETMSEEQWTLSGKKKGPAAHPRLHILVATALLRLHSLVASVLYSCSIFCCCFPSLRIVAQWEIVAGLIT